jgi:hypothetical protein
VTVTFGRRRALTLAGAGLLGVACGPAVQPTPTPRPGAVGAPPSKDGWTVVLPSSDLAVGPNRFLYAVLDERNRPIQDATIRMRFFDLAKGEVPQAEAEPAFRGQGLGAKGVYVARVQLPSAGDWGVEAQVTRPDGATRTLRTRFQVQAQSKTPPIGAPALPTKQALMTGAADPRQICTAVPACDFHDMTVADALAARRPILLLLATPGYCSSAVCGPDLQTVQSIEPEYHGRVSFLHVEIYQDPNTQTPLPAVVEWNLPSEPWVFLVDRDGKIADKLEGGLTADELKEGLARLV